jgi:hypothetical protein
LCGKCSGNIESISYTDIKNRGCCWYFPEYRLVDIKNILMNGKLCFIKYLISLPNSKVGKFSIKVLGKFFKKQYTRFLNSDSKKYDGFNTSLFFKLCPFLGKDGCTIETFMRPHPCNLYLCREVIKSCGDLYARYSTERRDYYAYCNYVDECLKEDLTKNCANFIDSPEKSIEIIKNSRIPSFCFRNINTIHFN